MDITGSIDNVALPIYAACRTDDLGGVKKLLAKGANVNSKCPLGVTPLHLAVRRNSRQMVALLLKNGADVNAKDTNNVTPLHIAAQMESNVVVKLLLEHGANVDAVNVECKTVLHEAVETGNTEIVDCLLKKGANPNKSNDAIKDRNFWTVFKYGKNKQRIRGSPADCFYTALTAATRNNNEAMVKLLVDHGAEVRARDAHKRNALFYAAANANAAIFKLLSSNGGDAREDPDLLSVAVRMKSKEIVEILLDSGVDVNSPDSRGRTALPYVAMDEQLYFDPPIEDSRLHADREVLRAEVAEVLLKRGAHVNARDGNGNTALHAAAKYGYVELLKVLFNFFPHMNAENRYKERPLHLSTTEAVTRMLLERCGRINYAYEDVDSPLHRAVKKGSIEIVKTLLEFKANVNCSNKRCETPLFLSAATGNTALCKMLIQNGSVIDAQDDYGETPLHIACAKGHLKVVKILVKNGANIDCLDLRDKPPLFCACLGGNIEILKYLLNHNPDIDHVNDGVIPKTLLEYIKWSAEPKIIVEQHIIRALVEQHIIRVKALGLNVSARNWNEINLDGSWEGNFFIGCNEEVVRMRLTEIGNSNVSYCDLLTKSVDRIATYLTYASDASGFEVPQSKDSEYKRLFPIYCDMIDCKLDRVRDKAICLTSCVKVLNFLWTPGFPDIVSEIVLKYLNDKDRKNLIIACCRPRVSPGLKKPKRTSDF